jgi:hypothetical protein
MNFFNLDNPNNWMYVGIIVCVFILIATFGIYCNINLFKNNKKRFAKEALRGNNKITVCFLPRQKDKANEFKQ